MSGRSLNSLLVMISWWSNCLGLVCLDRLVKYTGNREIYVVQVGKSDRQKKRFRENMPTQVIELLYPENGPAEHSRVLEDIVLRQLRSASGIWFIDHDVFIDTDCQLWLREADDWLNQSSYCLGLATPISSPAITSPTFWISPARWPTGTSSFDPIPFQTSDVSRRPDLFRHNSTFIMPEKDTLVQARDELIMHKQVGYFLLTDETTAAHFLTPFPCHSHLGGLSLFTGPVPSSEFNMPPAFNLWMKETLAQFIDFYETCPASLIAIEDPELMNRYHEFKRVVYA